MGEGLKVGDRVKVTHRPEHDREYPHDTVIARRANSGRSGTITDCSNARGLCFEVDTQSGKRAWFEPDELTPETLPDVIRAAHAEDVKTITGAALPPIGAKVRPKGGLHAGRVLEVMQHRGGEMLAEKGPWIGWYGPDAVTDPNGLPVEPAVPPVERRCGDGEHVRGITESAKALDRAATHWKRAAEEAKEAIDGWVARCDTLRAELATEREARQAADVLARQLGEAANHAQIGEGAARMQLSRVAAAWDAVQCSRRGGSVEDRHNAEDNMVRALAGVPAPVEAAVPLGDAADLAALIAKVEADPLHNRGGVVSSALLVDVLRAVERRLVAVERPAGEVTLSAVSDHVAAIDQRLLAVELEQTRRPRVGPWTASGSLLDDRGCAVALVWPMSGSWRWQANRPHLLPMSDKAATEDEAKAAALASLSTWCDVADAPEPREP